jgi:probable F420-dependent oxidoreductase
MTELTFGVSLGGWASTADLLEAARRAEEGGIDTVTVADHLGAPAPFQVLAAAAVVTERVRLRTYVLNAYFWHAAIGNAALLAREVATLDTLSGGRVELGVGAGHMRHEHESAALPFPNVTRRWADTEALLADLRRRLADSGHTPAAVQQPVPLMVAAMGERGLRVAARHADVVGLPVLNAVPGTPAGTYPVAAAATPDERVELVHTLAAEHDRDPRLDVLLQRVVLDADPGESAAAMAAEATAGGADWFTAELLLDSPFLLFAESAEAGAAELRRRSERWGITSWSTHSPSAEALTRVAHAHRAGPSRTSGYSSKPCSGPGKTPERTSSA